jgi:hypothetical protein
MLEMEVLPDERMVLEMHELVWRSKFLTTGATSLGEMADMLEAAAGRLREMEAAGVVLDGCLEDDYAFLYTNDPEIAQKFGFTEEVTSDVGDDDFQVGRGHKV